MKVCGVIAEYDPFHRGHERHLKLAREKTGADFILCVMSGFYTQRGMPALLPPDVRARMALLSGADVVLQLPTAFSLREGDWFARGGVEILEKLNAVDYLSFGCETEDVSLLQKAAELMENRPEKMEKALLTGLEKGLSYAAAQGQALEICLGPEAKVLQQPNAALGLCYLRALGQMNSAIRPVVVGRHHAYHAEEMEDYPSATAVRGATLRGDWKSVEKAIPEKALPVLREAVAAGRLCRPENVDSVLRHALWMLGEEGIRKLPGVDEGLEKRILQAVRKCTNREEMLSFIKTKRYTQGRISRALCWGMLGMEKENLPRHPSCVQVLGFRERARPLLKKMQEGHIPLVMKKARETSLDDEMGYADIWQLLCRRDMGEHYRSEVQIVKE